ncbi:hypothetical protein GDO78_018238 [Eleutherodactylus coqui]|uniref:Calmodulin-binding domain-containing protein n=1 Tax=Eleutherodactylus coqui TaxID=57060 RepID=A0A8J6JR31_ELECQ|nr:hypothetical protein GDO78_018238 [Eleutherodactylus coqui]
MLVALLAWLLWFVYLYLMKCTISISTVILLILIIGFHVKEIQLFMTDNSLVHWRIAVNAKKLAWIFLEILVCAIHPFPYEQRCEETTLVFLSQTDIFLSILMFLHIHGATNLTNAMWLIPITFLTIGYGDMVPGTVCGKILCLFTGVMGVGCTALIVAVAAQKLEFTKAEKHVHNFMMDIHYTKQIKRAAADVLGEAWLLHRHTLQGDMAKIHLHQRELLGAIHIFRRRRIKHKNLKDQVNAMVDISKMQMIMTDLDCNFSSSHQNLEKRIDQLDKKLDEISRLILTAIESPQLSH